MPNKTIASDEANFWDNTIDTFEWLFNDEYSNCHAAIASNDNLAQILEVNL